MQMGMRPQPVANQISSSNEGPVPPCTCNNGSNDDGSHAPGCLWRAPDQFIHDSLWAGYLDSALDIDLFLHDGVGFTQYMSFEGSNIAGQSAIGEF